jgi:ABC-2 type transport system ATP-binding protein
VVGIKHESMRKGQTSHKKEHNTRMCFPLKPVFTRDKGGLPNFMDEPTVGLDPKQIIEVRELIKKLGENHTVILSSHILSEISAVCDHVFIISKGKLVASDATENLINLMSKNQEINLVLKSDEIGARGMLEKIVNVDKVTFEKSEEEKTVKAKVIAKANCDIREEIFELASAMHMPILEMHTVVKSLEDVFLELTGEGDEK